MAKPLDLTGKRFGHLVALYLEPERRDGALYWRARCDCGVEKSISRANLVKGTTKSCGCFRRARAEGLNRTHGATKTPEYIALRNLRLRCEDPRDPHYPDYGARGITVCARWQRNFEAFLADMGPRPSKTHSIDRIDNDGGYWCGRGECSDCGPLNRSLNCRWATMTEQQRNRRSNVHYEVDGVSRTLVEWSEMYSINATTITARLARGWSVKDAITLPLIPARTPRRQHSTAA